MNSGRDGNLALQVEIDKLDAEILRSLMKDARTSFSEIGKTHGVSANTIRNRFNKMKEDGIIKGATVHVSSKSLGYDCSASLGIKADSSNVKQVIDFLKNIPNAIFIVPTIGRYNILAHVTLRNMDELSQMKEYIKKQTLVKELKVIIWVNQNVSQDYPENLLFEHLIGGDNSG
jgi:DNA-binding Lrp family transcriptional regulator